MPETLCSPQFSDIFNEELALRYIKSHCWDFLCVPPLRTIYVPKWVIV